MEHQRLLEKGRVTWRQGSDRTLGGGKKNNHPHILNTIEKNCQDRYAPPTKTNDYFNNYKDLQRKIILVFYLVIKSHQETLYLLFLLDDLKAFNKFFLVRLICEITTTKKICQPSRRRERREQGMSMVF